MRLDKWDRIWLAAFSGGLVAVAGTAGWLIARAMQAPADGRLTRLPRRASPTYRTYISPVTTTVPGATVKYRNVS